MPQPKTTTTRKRATHVERKKDRSGWTPEYSKVKSLLVDGGGSGGGNDSIPDKGGEFNFEMYRMCEWFPEFSGPVLISIVRWIQSIAGAARGNGVPNEADSPIL